MKVTVKIKSAGQVLAQRGLQPGGSAQAFHTQNVMRRIQKYMPFKTGSLIKLMQIQSPDMTKPYIVIDAPQARYLYYGKLMVDPITRKGAFYNPDTDRFWSRPGVSKVLTDTPLNYNTAKNPLAGPFWDRRLKGAEGEVMTAELQAYINRIGGGSK